MPGLDNKISNIIGSKLPQWIIEQLGVRSFQNSRDSRDNDNLLYLGNKSAWVRLVSSVNVTEEKDLKYFETLSGMNLTYPEDLAKKFVLYGGVSKYLNNNNYGLRSGINKDGAYGTFGTEEIQKYGYRPMPGITSVSIDTQGKLGSVRSATINFRCWDKAQLDIIDAIYFKLGYSMFLEWGHTFYYPNTTNPSVSPDNISKVQSSELFSIDPFALNGVYFQTKEQINHKIAENNRKSDGNYDAMLGIVTNFTFSYNQEGGYDCTLIVKGLGILGDSIKINNPGVLPKILTDEVVLLNETLKLINQPPTPQPDTNDLLEQLKREAKPGDILQTLALEVVKTYDVNGVSYETYQNLFKTNQDLFNTIALSNNNPVSDNAKKGLRRKLQDINSFSNSFVFAPSNFGFNIQQVSTGLPNAPTSYNYYRLDDKSLYNLDYFVEANNSYIIGKNSIILSDKNTYKNIDIDLGYLKTRYLEYLNSKNNIQVRSQFTQDQDLVNANLPSSVNVAAVDLLLNRSILAQNSNQGSAYGQYAYSYLKSSSPLYRFGITYTSPVYSNAMTKDAYFFSVAVNTDIKTKTGNNIAGIKATAPQVYNALAGLIGQDYLNDTSFADNKRPFSTFVNGGSQDPIIEPKVYVELNPNTNFYYFSVKLLYPIGKQNIQIKKQEAAAGLGGATQTVTTQESLDAYLEVVLSFNDTSLIREIETDNKTYKLRNEAQIQAELDRQNQIAQQQRENQRLAQKELAGQISQALSFQSSLEITLRTIQVHALNRAIYDKNPKNADLEIGRKVFVLKMAEGREKKEGFLSKVIFSNGLFSNVINSLIDNNNPIKIQNLNDAFLVDSLYESSDLEKFRINAKYGFATSLLKNKQNIGTIKPVNYNELFRAYVVPYNIDTDLIKGTKTNHPVYISLGLLLMILNHTCTIYDTRRGSKFQTPLIYIDYNPETNFFLTNPKQLSTNPWVTLVPFEGTDQDYSSIFPDNILSTDKKFILPVSGSTESVPLFKPRTEDLLSYQLPKIKADSSDENAYRGKLMNVLLRIDYLTQLVQQYSFRDGSNNVYLKPFLEQILSDVNKYLGNFNALRLSYNDQANTFQIVDDQVVPTLSEEVMVDPKASQNNIQNRTEIPLVGKTNIAKNLEIKTDVSNKLANMIAISANSNIPNKATLSTNGDPIGFMNVNYADRYIWDRLGINTGSAEVDNKNSMIIAATQFNQTISDFYSKINPSENTVSQATNFYINRMSTIKNDDEATRAAAMIPVGINFTTDGIGGLSMGQAFTVSNELIPYTYTSRNKNSFIDNYINHVGFAIVGLNHTIENNQWNTSVRTNMITLKDKTIFDVKVLALEYNPAQFSVNPNQNIGGIDSSKKFNVNKYSAQLNVIVPFFKKTLKFNDTATAAIIGNLIQESGLNYQAWNIGRTEGQVTTIEAGSSKGQKIDSYNPLTLTFNGRNITAYGIAQWTQTRKESYLRYQLNRGDSLQTQLNFISEELSKDKKNVATSLLIAREGDVVSAVNTWLLGYEGISADLQQRVSYANGVLEYIQENRL